jgi:hypothetical protein
MISAIHSTLGSSLLNTIDTHNTTSVIFIFSLASKKYLLKAEYGGSNTTAKEIAWYRRLPQGIDFVPERIVTFEGPDYAFLLLAYVENSQTIDQLVTKENVSAQQAFDYVRAALSYDEQLFLQNKPTLVPTTTIEEFFDKKYQQRMSEAQQFPYLRDLLQTQKITINGKQLHHPDYYIREIASNRALAEYLTPQTLGFIHGDLHCSNILVDQEDALYLVDPNGTPLMPIEYDYGKILHSVHGGYYSIIDQRYTIESSLGYEYRLDLATPPAYEGITQKLESKIGDSSLSRGLYLEALHFATMLPHHAKQEMETIVLFLRCVQLFNELFQRLNSKT